jgi:hypothetical protein
MNSLCRRLRLDKAKILSLLHIDDDARRAGELRIASRELELLGADNRKPMSENKHTVQKYMNAFTQIDHAEILSCLTDYVEWGK